MSLQHLDCVWFKVMIRVIFILGLRNQMDDSWFFVCFVIWTFSMGVLLDLTGWELSVDLVWHGLHFFINNLSIYKLCLAAWLIRQKIWSWCILIIVIVIRQIWVVLVFLTWYACSNVTKIAHAATMDIQRVRTTFFLLR